MVATSKATEQWSRRCWEVTSAKGERKTVDHAGVRCGKLEKSVEKYENSIKKHVKSTLEAPNPPKKLQESPREAPREPRASKKLPHEAPNPPKRVPRWSPKSIKIDKKSIQEAPKTPKSSQGRSKTDFLSIFNQFWIHFGSNFRSKGYKNSI